MRDSSPQHASPASQTLGTHSPNNSSSISSTNGTSRSEDHTTSILSMSQIQNILTTPMELQTLSRLICPITHLIYTEPVLIPSTSRIVESEYAIFISASLQKMTKQQNEATNVAEFMNIIYGNYPQLRDLTDVRYVPTHLVRDYMRSVKKGFTEKVLSIIHEFRGEFLGHTRLRKRIVKELKLMKRVERVQKEIMAESDGKAHPGLKWGTATAGPSSPVSHSNSSTHHQQQMDMNLKHRPSSSTMHKQYVVPSTQINQPTTYCHWLHYLLEYGSEQMILQVLEELSDTAQRKDRLVNVLLDSSANTKPISAFVYSLWTSKSMRVVKRLINLIGAQELNVHFPTKEDIETPSKKVHRDRLNMLLVKAIGAKDTSVVKLLLRFGADVMAYVDEVQATPLNYACRKNHSSMALVLIQHGADVNQVMDMNFNVINFRPLHYAVQVNDKDLVMALLERGAPLDAVATFEGNIDMTPLALAVQNDNYHTADYLLGKGASPNAPEESKIAATPIHLAIQNENEEMLNLLISNEASLDAVDTKGRNVLHLVAMQNNVDLARTLLEVDQVREELIDQPDYSGCTPLHYASQHEDMGVARELIASDKDGRITSAETRVEVSRESLRANNGGSALHTPSPAHHNNSFKKNIKSPLHPSQNALEGSNAGTGSINLLRERVAKLKRKIADIQVQHAAEVETLESQVHSMKSIAKNHYKEHARLLRKAKHSPSEIQKEKMSHRKSSMRRKSVPRADSSAKRPRSALRRSPSASRVSSTPTLRDSNTPKRRPASAARSRFHRTPTKSTTPSGKRPSTPSRDTPSSTNDAISPMPTKGKQSFKNVKPRVDSHNRRNSSPARSLSPLVRYSGKRSGVSDGSGASSPNLPRTAASPIRRVSVSKRSPVHKSAHRNSSFSPVRTPKHSATPKRSASRNRSLPRSAERPASAMSRRSSNTPHKSLNQKHYSVASPVVQARARVNSHNNNQLSKFGTLKRLNKATFVWSIPRSVATRKAFQEAILSKKFQCYGQLWRLKLYPQGAVDDGMVSFYIMQENGDYDNYDYTLDYSVEMINEIVPQQEDFRARNTFRRGEMSWGWSHYCPSKEVLDIDRGYINEKGQIEFHIIMSNLALTAAEKPSVKKHEKRVSFAADESFDQEQELQQEDDLSLHSEEEDTSGIEEEVVVLEKSREDSAEDDGEDSSHYYAEED